MNARQVERVRVRPDGSAVEIPLVSERIIPARGDGELHVGAIVRDQVQRIANRWLRQGQAGVCIIRPRPGLGSPPGAVIPSANTNAINCRSVQLHSGRSFVVVARSASGDVVIGERHPNPWGGLLLDEHLKVVEIQAAHSVPRRGDSVVIGNVVFKPTADQVGRLDWWWGRGRRRGCCRSEYDAVRQRTISPGVHAFHRVSIRHAVGESGLVEIQIGQARRNQRPGNRVGPRQGVAGRPGGGGPGQGNAPVARRAGKDRRRSHRPGYR